MSQLPGYFEYVRQEPDRKSQLHKFSYSQEDRKFNIGGKSIELVEFDPYTFDATDIGLDYEGMDVDEMTEHPALLPSFGGVIVGPVLHKWATEHPAEVADVYKVMYQAYVSFTDTPTGVTAERSLTHMGFSSGLREYGGIGLQVFGNCACIGPDPNSMVIDNQFESGFAQYELHNADSQPQRASLYAGIGHLARLAIT